MPLEAVAARVRESAPRARTTRVVSIDGPGGSGKSTLAARLAPLLGAPVVHMDDVYPGWDGLAAAGPLLRDWILQPLAAGRPVRYQRYDWSLEAYGDWLAVPTGDVLVVEGCGSGSRIVAQYLSLLLWVEASREVRFTRGIERDGEAYLPLWVRWAAQEDALFAAENTRERSDLRIDGAPALPRDPEREVVVL
ncbi:MAG: uridine kinase family protein [Jiangellaceae bacterium]